MSERQIKQVPSTMYDMMVFPDVEYQEFPRAVPVVDGKVMPTPYDEKHKPHPIVIVQNQRELDELLGAEEPVTLVALNEADPAGPKRVENEDDIREALYAQAKTAGVIIDKRWSVSRIEDTIRAHVASKDVT